MFKNNSPFHRAPPPAPVSRRDFLWRFGGGLGGVALTNLLGRDLFAQLSGPTTGVLHHPPKAKRVVQLFMAGAASHIDLFDFKPELIKRHGQPSDFGEKVETFQDGLGPWLRPVWDFKPYGQCGKQLSEIVAPLGACVDDIAFIHNMVGNPGCTAPARCCKPPGSRPPASPAPAAG